MAYDVAALGIASADLAFSPRVGAPALVDVAPATPAAADWLVFAFGEDARHGCAIDTDILAAVAEDARDAGLRVA